MIEEHDGRNKSTHYPTTAYTQRSYNCLRKTLYFFSSLFLVVGLGSVGVGAWILIQFGRLDVMFGIYKLLHPCGMLICAGGLGVLCVWCGVWSVGNRHQCCLRSYIALLILILTGHFVAGGLAFAYRRTVKVGY